MSASQVHSRRDEVLERWRAGETYADIAAELGDEMPSQRSWRRWRQNEHDGRPQEHHGPGEASVSIPLSRLQDLPLKTDDDHLRACGVDPTGYEMAPGFAPQVKRYGSIDEPMLSVHVRYVARTVPTEDEFEGMADRILRSVTVEPTQLRGKASTERATYVLALADWQLGDGGTPVSVERFKSQTLAHVQRIGQLGHFEAINLKGLADIVEACYGFYPSQLFTVDLTARQQRELAVSLLVWIIEQLTVLGLPIHVDAVPGNHGEMGRVGGKQVTNRFDNADLEVFAYAQRICEHNPAFRNVTWDIDDRMWRVVQHSGVLIGSQHGHLTSKGQGPGGKMAAFWEARAVDIAREWGAALDITFQGHYHHFFSFEDKGQTHIQVPGNDNGSEWFRDLTGSYSPPGMLGAGVGTYYGERKWGDLYIVGGETGTRPAPPTV